MYVTRQKVDVIDMGDNSLPVEQIASNKTCLQDEINMIKNFKRFFRFKRHTGNSPQGKEDQEIVTDKASTATCSLEEKSTDEHQDETESNNHAEPKPRQKWANKFQNFFCMSTENPDNGGSVVSSEHSESLGDDPTPCVTCQPQGKVHFDEIAQVNPEKMSASPHLKHIAQIGKRKRRKYVRVKPKCTVQEKVDDKSRLFEIAFNVELRRIFIKVPYFFNTFKNELQGRKIGNEIVTEVNETKLRISIERMIAYMWPLQKEQITPFMNTLPDDCDMNKAVNYFRREMKKSYGAYIKNFPQMMGLVVHMYFDKTVPLDVCLRVYRLNQGKCNTNERSEEKERDDARNKDTSPAKHDKCIETDFDTEKETLKLSTKIAGEKGESENIDATDRDDEVQQQQCNSTNETELDQGLYTNSDNEVAENEKENGILSCEGTSENENEISTSEKDKYDSKESEFQEENTCCTAAYSDAYFEIGQYRLDGSIAVGKCKKGSKREFERSAKKKVKSRGVPNKHLKNDENILLENAFDEEIENCGENEAQDNFWSQNHSMNLQAGDASVSSTDFSNFYIIPDEDAEPDMRHEELDSCVVIRGKKSDCDRLEETYNVGERKSNKPRRQQQKRKNKKETIFLLYNMNNNASSEDISDADSTLIEYSDVPLIEDNGCLSESD